jgi:AcrR family transcriptional regulator
VIGETTPTRREERHAATRQQILDVTWELAEEVGIASISLREIARRVGMRQPSLYSYFASKHDLYNAMFKQGNDELFEMTQAIEPSGDAREDLLRFSRMFAEFNADSAPRSQLLFLRTIPGYEPSAEAYESAVKFYDLSRDRLRALGLTKQRQMDIWVAMLGGVIQAQAANDPGGDRWVRTIPEVVDMFLDHYLSESETPVKKGRAK